ncbi:MAG: hypothetical protein WBP81_07435 [Solirubrobacteraceae bacterium]
MRSSSDRFSRAADTRSCWRRSSVWIWATEGSAPLANFTAEQVEDAGRIVRERGLARFAAIQNEDSLLVGQTEREVLPACERLGLGFGSLLPAGLWTADR